MRIAEQVTCSAEAGASGMSEITARSEHEARSEAILTIPGMGSDHCAGIVTQSIRRLPGIDEVKTNIAAHRANVRFDPAQTSPDAIRSAVEKAGYDVDAVQAASSAHDSEDAEERYLALAVKRLWIAAIPATLIMLLMIPHMFWRPVPGYLAIVAVLAFPVVFLYGGWATHRSAWRSLTNRTANMDVLISMGSLPPYLIGLAGFIWPMTSFIEMAATIMTFHLLGRYLETRAKGRASQAIKRLLALGAKTATVIRDGREVDIPVAELAIGDVMRVRPVPRYPPMVRWLKARAMSMNRSPPASLFRSKSSPAMRFSARLSTRKAF